MDEYINTGAYLRDLSDQLREHLHAEFEQRGYGHIRPSHGLVFQYIQAEGSRTTELALKAGMTKQSMSVIVQELEQWGYVRREEDPRDGRAVLFILTDSGQEIRQLGRQINRQFEQKWEGILGADRYQAFREDLKKLKGSKGEQK